MRGGGNYDVFLSYSRSDAIAAETLRARLKEQGLKAFVDRYGLPAGQPWQPWIEEHLTSCRALVVLVGPLGFGEWQHREIQLGLDRQASSAKTGQAFPVVPVLLPGLANDSVPIGSFLSLNTWVDLRPGLDEPESLQRLIAGAQGRAIDAGAAEKLLTGLTPYRGLLPFREQDAGLFFGRERFVTELVQKVGQRNATNVVAVIGRSGSGKSSIVYAGLFPTLRREKGLGDQSVWRIVRLRPYAEALHQLAAAFDPPRGEPDSMEWLAALNAKAKLFRSGDVNLAQLVRARLNQDKGSTRILLYVDQWEELYTQAQRREVEENEDPSQPAQDVKLFTDLVLGAAAKSPCTLVLSARSDFYPDIQNHDGLRAAVQESQVSLGTMNEAELRAVIEGPPGRLGASVDKKLTERLIRDIGLDPASGRSDEYDIGKLPLLEYALEQAWTKRTGSRIGLENYSGLEQALEERANALFARLSAEEQAAAKRLFVSLVTPGEGREDTRARIDMPDDAAMRRVIQTFAGGQARLIVTDKAGERGSVEVSHEALIRHWRELRQWIDANRENLRTRARLKEERTEWLKRNKDPELLGIPSLRLREVQKLSEEPGDVRTDDIKDYIDALLDHDRTRKEAKEAEEREELEAARRLADERARSAETERGLRRNADEQKAAALQNESAALTALSHAARPTNPSLAAKLALAAWPRDGADPRPKVDFAFHALSAVVPELLERKVIRGYDDPVQDVIISNDSYRAVTISSDKTARFWDTSTGKKLTVLHGHDDVVLSAAFSPDGTRAITTSADSTARIWDTMKGTELTVLRGHGDRVLSAAFSLDGAHAVTASYDRTARIWDTSTGNETAVLRGHGGPIWSAAFSLNGERIITASSDKTAVLWNGRQGYEMIAVLQGHDDAVISATFSPKGELVVTASRDKTARIWDVTSRVQIAVLRGHDGEVSNVAFSPDESRIVTASVDKTARIWDGASGEEIAVLRGHDGPVLRAKFSSDSGSVITASSDKTARIWDAGAAAVLSKVGDDWKSSVMSAVSPDGVLVTTGFFLNDTTSFWDPATGTRLVDLRGYDGEVLSAAFSPDRARIVTAGGDTEARIWDAHTGNEIAVLRGHVGRVNTACFSPNGALVVTASDDKSARLWDGSRKTVVFLRGHTGAVESAAFSPDGARIATASDDWTARLWDSGGNEVATLSGHEGRVHCAAFSPNGAHLITGSDDQTARLWDGRTGNAVAVLRGHNGAVTSACFSPDGTRFLTAARNETWLWDAATCRRIVLARGTRKVRSVIPERSTPGIAGTVRAVFTPDGQRILVGSIYGTACTIWDISKIPKGNLFQVACAWLPDHDLAGVAKDFGLTSLDPICELDPPLPDHLPQ